MDITPIVEAIIALIAAVITVFVIPWIKSKTTSQQRKDIIAWVDIAVSAAEQIYNGPGRGMEKKNYVLKYLNSKGLKIDDATIDMMIESAVLKLNSNKLELITEEVVEEE